MTRAALLFVLLVACVPAPRPMTEPAARRRTPLPPIPVQAGPLAIDLVYPSEGWVVGTDSTFVFGSVGTGDATLQINNAPVDVTPNGAFLAYLPVPRDGRYELIAARGAESRRALRTVRPTMGDEALPRGSFTRMAGETFELRVRGAPGARTRLLLPDGNVVPLMEQQSTERAEGFLQDLTVPPRPFTEYVGSWIVRSPVAEGQARLEWVRGGQTTRTSLPISLAVIPEGTSRVGVAQKLRTQRHYHRAGDAGLRLALPLVFPTGTRLAITGEQSGMLRVRLTRDLSVWVNAADVRLLGDGASVPRGGVRAIRAVPAADHVELRLAMTERLPFRVDGAERGFTVTVYGAQSRTNWVHHSTQDPLIRRIEWEQPRDDEYRVRVELTEPLWGWEPVWDRAGNLVIRVRRPPPIDPREPLRGLRIAVDAGHPPGGAIGPTRFTEAEANLAISKRLVAMLRARGAEVLETRPDTAAVALGERPLQATRWGAHLLVSVHNNAFPDGVNPFVHAGTSVFYNQPQSLDFARSVQNELLREFGLPDLGIARADLALVRPSALPSILTETMFLMVPEQENALRDPGVHERIAQAHLRGIEAFLRGRAGER